MRGRTKSDRPCAFLMKWSSIFSVTSKSAMTPSFMGRMATMLPGVRPSISLASVPTASTRLVCVFTATIDGSRTMMPLPRAKISVFAVPRSTARSLEKIEKTDFQDKKDLPQNVPRLRGRLRARPSTFDPRPSTFAPS